MRVLPKKSLTPEHLRQISLRGLPLSIRGTKRANSFFRLIANLCKDPELKPDPEGIAKALRPPLLKTFPAALLGRLTVIPYYPLSDDMLKMIIRLQLSRIQKRVAENQGVPLSYHESVVELIASRCTELESGGRMVDAILTQTLLPEISREFLNRMLEGQTPSRVEIGVQDANFTYSFQ